MRMTGGTIEYSERRKVADYEHKETRFVLSFAIDDTIPHLEVQEYLDRMQEQVRDRVRAMLGLNAGGVKPAISHGATVAKPAAASKTGEAAPPPTPAPTEIPEEIIAPKQRAKRAKPPVAVVDEAPEDEPAAAKAPEVVDDFDEPEAAEITDVQLTEAVRAKAAKLGDAKAVRELMGTKYKVPRVSAIPQEKRAEFLAAVEALK